MKTGRLLSLVLVVALAISLLAGCSGSNAPSTSDSNVSTSGSNASTSTVSKPSGSKTIAVLMQRTTEKRYSAADIPALKAEAEALGYKITVQSAETNGETQIKQAEIAIMQNVDAIILQAVNVKAGASIVKEAQDAGIRVIAYNDIIEDTKLDGFVGRDSKKLGYDEAKKMLELYPKGNYMIVGGDNSAAVARLMMDGYHEALKDINDVKVVSEQYNTSWSAESALKQTEGTLLANNNNISAILSSNDTMAVGAIQALDTVGIAGNVGICGQDAETAALKKIKEGKMSFTAFTEFAQMGKDAIDLADAILNGKSITSTTFDNGKGGKIPWIPTNVIFIDKSNLDDFISQHSWWVTADEVK